MIKNPVLPVVILSLSLASYHGVFLTDPNIVLLKAITKARGSGVVIRDGWILTAKHVLPVMLANGMPCTKMIAHPYLDLALVRCPGAKAHGLRLGDGRALDLYDRLYAYGWHKGRLLLKTKGYQGYPFNTMSAPVIHGCSGGAVVNDRGELVGILQSVGYTTTSPPPGRRSDHKHGYAMPHMAWYTPLDVDAIDWILQYTER